MNLFEMFADEIEGFEQEQKELAENNNANKKENKNKSKNEQKKEPKPVTKVDPNKGIEGEINKYPKIVVKAYGTELMQIEGETEVQSIKLSEISDRLINEFQYNEFSQGIKWHLVPNEEKTVGYLVATGNFYAKG